MTAALYRKREMETKGMVEKGLGVLGKDPLTKMAQELDVPVLAVLSDARRPGVQALSLSAHPIRTTASEVNA